jgi:hypothetical protein
MTHMAFGGTKIKCAVSRGLGEGRRRKSLDNETSRVGHPGTVRWFRRLGAVTAGAGPCGNGDGKIGNGAGFGLFRDSFFPQIFTCR